MYSHLNDNDISFVPFVGVCSTREHPFALVFRFMDHMNLRGYLRDNQDIGRLQLVRVHRHVRHPHRLTPTPVIGNRPWSEAHAWSWHGPRESQHCGSHPPAQTLNMYSHSSRLMFLWAVMDMPVSQV